MLEPTIYVALFLSLATLSFDSKLPFTQTFWFTSFCVRANIIPKNEVICSLIIPNLHISFQACFVLL